MGIEIPPLPLKPGDTISLEQLFKLVSLELYREGLVPPSFTSDEWATTEAERFKNPEFAKGEVIDDKG